MQISKASEHDRKIAEETLSDVHDIRLFADMALLDGQWQAKMLDENNVEILTPIKRKKGQKILPSAGKFLSSAISGVNKQSSLLITGLSKRPTFKGLLKCALLMG